jgi:hypothetical protein
MSWDISYEELIRKEKEENIQANSMQKPCSRRKQGDRATERKPVCRVKGVEYFMNF